MALAPHDLTHDGSPVLDLAGLDFDVLVPADAPTARLQVREVHQTFSGEGVDERFWDCVSVGVAGDDGRAWPVVRTVARRGVRPTGAARSAALTVDPDLTAVARSAVHDRARVEVVVDPLGWERRTMSVDGRSYALWVHATPDRYAACADLGPVLVGLHGTRLPRRWEFRFLSAADARRTLR